MVGDAELAIAAAGGDRDSLASIYDRYADTVYELCWAVLRDEHEASDVVQATFVIAATRLGGLRDPDRLKPWLCAIARREAIRRSSKRARNRPSQVEALAVPVIDDSADGLIGNDAVNLVWDAAASLTERERALVVLNVRQGFEGADLADAAGMSSPQVSVMSSRAKSQLAIAVRTALLIRDGRRGCPELSSIVPHAHHALDGVTRKRVARHAQSCENCEPKWNASPDALGVLAAAPLLGAPAALKAKVLDDPRLISTSRPLGGRGWQRDGFPPPEERPRRRVYAALAAAVLLLGVAVGLVLASDNNTQHLVARDRDPTTTVVDESTTTTTPTTSVVPVDGGATATTAGRGRTAPTVRPRAGAAATVRPGSGGVAPTAPRPATTTTSGALRISAAGPSSMTTCSPASVSASTTGGPTRPLYLHYNVGGSTGSRNMQPAGSGWAAQLSVGSAGQGSWWVSTDPSTAAYGSGTTSASHALTVTACA